MFGNNIPRAEAARLYRELNLVTTERDELKARLGAQDATVWNLEQDLAKAREAQPVDLTEVTEELRALLPSLPRAASFSDLKSATSPAAFASALFSLMQHARMIGFQEAGRRR